MADSGPCKASLFCKANAGRLADTPRPPGNVSTADTPALNRILALPVMNVDHRPANALKGRPSALSDSLAGVFRGRNESPRGFFPGPTCELPDKRIGGPILWRIIAALYV